ncbi:SCP2 sterol-binding domain-containing protein [uncultured Aliiroseovarius sp.]|uniref:SCP2 sterol-binding domain-containing protein n=1 Tax=uncultured Aliiroseovarius sp. TaxID=1658783 RepID=UPI0025914417|nr:SCP2 sterol-binding domain-containing protein [uncultured Aliiroseovarius sp.]
MPLQKIAEGIQAGLDGRGFDGSLKFDCGPDGVIVLADNHASTQDRDTDCALRLSTEHLQQLLAGKLNPMTAVMMGKIKISGDVPTALKLAKLLG